MKIDLNTVILVVALGLMFLYFDRLKPSGDLADIKEQQAVLEDSVKLLSAKADSLKSVNDTLKIQLIMTEAAFEVAYTKYNSSVGNTVPVRKKHEEIRNKLLQLGSDDAIRLLAKRAAAIDSLRQRIGQSK